MSDLATNSWKTCNKTEQTDSEAEGLKLGISRARRPLELARTRLIVAGCMFSVCFLILAIRLMDLSVIGSGSESSGIQLYSEGNLILKRRDIVDRNNIVLATNLPTDSLYVDPAEVLEPQESIAKIKSVLPNIQSNTLLRLINSGGRFHWVKRNLTPEQMWKVNALGLPGFKFKKEERRVYPHGTLFAHALGFAGVDNRGLSGVESALDTYLSGNIEANAKPLRLSLDLKTQHALVTSLSEAMASYEAKGAAGLVLNVNNGEIIAMASLPAFDPNVFSESSADERFNRATLGVYELGSVFKAFNTAMALESGMISLDSQYDATKPLKVSRFYIRDDHPENRWLSVPEIFIHSSNIGSARMAMEIGSKKQQDFLSSLGMFDPISIEIPESGHPIKPSTWRDSSTMTIAFGHGIAVTPLHALNGFATIVNGGIKRKPTILMQDKKQNAPEGSRIISTDTSIEMRKLLYRAVTEGTGKQAQVDGYLIGGKTGTAEKAVAGKYQRKAVISTFIAAFPIDKPRYAVLVSLDEPKGNKLTHNYIGAGWTAAPTTGQIIKRIGPLLGIAPLFSRPISPEEHKIVRPEKNILRAAFRRNERATF